jgi:hypothetical protein
VSKSQPIKQVRRRGRPRIMGPSLIQAQPSTASVLPPDAAENTLAPPIDKRFPCQRCGTKVNWDTKECPICDQVQPKPAWYLPPDSKCRVIALQAIAMRIAGMEDPDIAKALGISVKSISPYIYRAGKNGWLDIDNPKMRMQYQVMHKVVRNLDEMLDSPDPGIKERITVEAAKGTVFKEFGEQQQQAPVQTVVAIRIDMPAGPTQEMRDDTTGGTPAYVDAEKV